MLQHALKEPYGWILNVFVDPLEFLHIKEISIRSQVNIFATYRALNDLVELGFVEKYKMEYRLQDTPQVYTLFWMGAYMREAVSDEMHDAFEGSDEEFNAFKKKYNFIL